MISRYTPKPALTGRCHCWTRKVGIHAEVMWMIGVPKAAPAIHDQNFGDLRISAQGSAGGSAAALGLSPESAVAGGRNQSSHKEAQVSPAPPSTMNPARQPMVLASQIMTTGATRAPRLPPLIIRP